MSTLRERIIKAQRYAEFATIGTLEDVFASAADAILALPEIAAALERQGEKSYDQPFGFTQDDVDELRRTALDIRKRLGYCEAEARIEWLSDRVAALLPPDGKR